jgi:4-hydroxybenzoate polyprenyltransferase
MLFAYDRIKVQERTKIMPISAETPARFGNSSVCFKWNLFLGLSRTPHALLDMATPAMAALLWLGRFPSSSVLAVGLVTAFAGYTAVYALNDVVDYKVDRERLAFREKSDHLFDLDNLTVPHPLAQGFLPFSWALGWLVFWAIIALAGAWWLNPICALIFLLSAFLETIYCKLLKITHLKIIPSALVKASGGLAGVYAVDPLPSVGFVTVLLLWLAAWEVGGQNIANDIMDMNDDAKVAARTTSTVKGVPESIFRIVSAVSIAAFAGISIYSLAGRGVGMLYPFGAALLGWLLLMRPARSLYYDAGPGTAALLFNRASYMPLGFLLLTAVSILFPV